MWYGEYNHSLDEKDRFIFPAKFREKIKELDKKKFFITRGLDSCLFIFHQHAWESLEQKLKAVSFTKPQARAFNRLYFSGASEFEVDAQGRVVVPSYLKEFAQIKKDIVIIGVADRIELWDKDHWEKFYQDNKTRFEETAENIFDQ